MKKKGLWLALAAVAALAVTQGRVQAEELKEVELEVRGMT